jgi:hypothetical protein
LSNAKRSKSLADSLGDALTLDRWRQAIGVMSAADLPAG